MISSRKNPRIVTTRKLGQRKHRQKLNLLLAEGLQILSMAMDCRQRGNERHIVPVDVFYCRERFRSPVAETLLQRLSDAGAEPTPVADHVLDALSERETSQGLVATFRLRPLERPIAELSSDVQDGPILVLDRLQDPGNLGTLIRTADAVGAHGVVLIEPCVDPYDPKTVRSTMGSIFSVPLARASDVNSVFGWLRRDGRRAVGADVGVDRPVWDTNALAGRIGLFLGNEARGLSDDVRSGIEAFVGLPMAGSAESLNVAVAGGVLLYEWIRTNRPAAPRFSA